jgi:2,4-didehydro-3-deoxy-L-rhamnonate hydrolase
MRVANLRGRLSLLSQAGAIDVAEASGGRFSPDPQSPFGQWDEFAEWASQLPVTGGAPYRPEELGPPVPRPGQVFAIALNYRDHADEARLELPSEPPTFTKFPSCLTGPDGAVTLSGEAVDWEVELVVVIGREARGISAADAWSVVAGVTVGQDISDRVVQMRPPAPQFSLGKSFPGYGPIGPAIITLDELDDPDDLELGCRVNGEEVQKGRTSDMIFSVPELIARLSQVVTLRPGDLIFTGTPSGVGAARTPPRFLRPGDVLTSYIQGVGEMRHAFEPGSAA